MGIREQVGKLLGRGVQLAQKASPYLFIRADGKNPAWGATDYQSFVSKGFEKNALIHAAIMYKVRAISLTRMRGYSGDPENLTALPLNHPLSQLFVRPNPHMSWVGFEGLNTIYLNLSGNAYVYLDRNGKGIPKAMYPLRPDRVFMIPDRVGVKGYLYIPPGKTRDDAIPILPDQMIHVKMPNPNDEYEGMGYGSAPLSAGSQSMDVDNAVTKFLKNFIDGGAMPAGILKFNMSLSDTEVAQARGRWRDLYGGSENWADVAVMDNGGDYQRIGMNFNEMSFDTIDERNEARLLSVLGVPGILLDSRIAMKTSTYANKAEARKGFWEDTFPYELSLWGNEYEWQLTDDTITVMRDYSQVPALRQNMTEAVTATKNLWSMGMPLNIAMKTAGLKVEGIEGGDVGYLPMNVREVGAPMPDKVVQAEQHLAKPEATDADMPDDADAPDEEEMPSEETPSQEIAKALMTRGADLLDADPFGATEAKKVLLWKAIDSIARKHEPEALAAAESAFEAEKRDILAIVNEEAKNALKRKSTIDWISSVDKIWLYYGTLAPEKWEKKFATVFMAVVKDNGEYWAAKLGFAFNVRNVLGEAWFLDYKLKFAKPINDTSLKTLQELLAKGQAEGWSIPEMQKNITNTFEQWKKGNLSPEDAQWVNDRLPPWRSELIARTETTRIQAAGTQALFTDWGVENKEWLATRDRRTRPSHSAADGQVKKNNEPFSVGGYSMMYPGDMSLGAPVSEIADCRCTMIPADVYNEVP